MSGGNQQTRTRRATRAPRCEVRPARIGLGVFAIEPIAAGAWAVELNPIFDDRPGQHTIQVGDRKHQSYTDEVDDYLNHACDPSAYLDAESLRVVAFRPIDVGDEITINYAASEWDMVEPFVCTCDHTARTIRGFRHLSPADYLRIAHLVPAWLRTRRTRAD